ncbi:hypothetical protein CCACVL1_30059 [Corchorus capsularis]|uniref:Uncharacterized protein n=1 Tax=Corchorus capsularis TaxID=210143 RepID=A0A1R3FZ19_COCAP|nr:hypothetical protein CCACVL1_30059 [Corchorus capsularis]
MENTSKQNVNSEEIVEFEDDEVNTMEEKEVPEGEDATDHVIEDSIIEALQEPYVGMEFESPDDAQEYYNKEGCKAMLRISKKEEQKWVISRFHAAHNHELAMPKSTPLIRSHRKRSRVQKDLMDVLADSGIRPSKIVSVLSHESGGLNNLNMTDRDVFNYLSLKRQKQIEKGDAQVMLDYFHDCQSKNPGFFYSIQTDVDGRLANCFWVDARSRMAYKHFGDVIAFDPTYLTNKYRMSFVPFAGVNHHFQSVLFGCALLQSHVMILKMLG